MKIRLLPFLMLTLCTALVFTACKKDNSSSSDNTDPNTAATVQSDDQAQVSEDVDAISNDAEAAVSVESSMSGRVLTWTGCNAVAVADTTGDTKKITITYNGADCFNARTRTGVIVISMNKGVHWKDAGAVITINVQNLKITRTRDNKSITINGTKTITNVSGGLLVDLATKDQIVHDINSDGITVTFDNNKERNWKLAIRRTFEYDNGIVASEEGTHTEGAISGIAVWGTNRFGNAFSWTIAAPLVVRQDCNFRLVSGIAVHTGVLGVATTTFGLDATGVATSCPGTGSYYFKTVFVSASNSNSYTFILPY